MHNSRWWIHQERSLISHQKYSALLAGRQIKMAQTNDTLGRLMRNKASALHENNVFVAAKQLARDAAAGLIQRMAGR